MSLFSAKPRREDGSLKETSLNDIQDKLGFLLIIAVMCLCCCSPICGSDFQPLFKIQETDLASEAN